MATLVPKLTSTPSNPPTYNVGMAETFSWVPIEGAGRPLYARAGYITNLSDLSINLSAAEMNISALSIKDGNSSRVADVEDIGNGLNALRVINQNLEPDTDIISLADVTGNKVTVVPSTSSLNVNVTNQITATIDTTTAAVPVTFGGSSQLDAFGRLRTSNPLTLFDSAHRYQDNNLWATLTAAGGTPLFNPNQGLIDMSVNSLSGSSVIRETRKVFAYQSGKSLLTMNTLVMAPSATNVRQRVGYFGQDNGFYLQLNDGDISFVRRTIVDGTPATETIVNRSSWNADKLDGTGPSGVILDITKSQILWMDFEWLGSGAVRAGFVFDGTLVICHKFQHANIVPSTYISTASLPLRYEITNTGATTGSRTLKQICSTVISEGGYELRGLQQAVSTPINAPRTFDLANVFYPTISLRLKTSPNRLDAIIIPTAVSLLGIGNGINYNWQIRTAGITSGGTWVSAGVDSSIEYNRTGTGFTGGRILASGFISASNQGSQNLDIIKNALFRFQLERDGLVGIPTEFNLTVATDIVNGSGVFASVDWEEVSR
jgi:hypothetical protein